MSDLSWGVDKFTKFFTNVQKQLIKIQATTWQTFLYKDSLVKSVLEWWS